MQALPLLRRPFKLISLDFIIDLLLSKDSKTRLVANYLLVIVNQYTKEPEYILCLKTIDILSLAKLFIKYQFKDYSLPILIISNRGSIFTSYFQEALCFYLGISRGLSTVFHLQTNSQTERQNQTLKQQLCYYIYYM